MKLSSLSLLVAAVVLYSCGDIKPDMSTPAMTGIETPVFDGMVDAMRGDAYATLPPFATVYIQGDSLTIQNAKYVKIWWNDSSGYIPAGWAMPGFRKAVYYSANDPEFYLDKELTIGADGNTEPVQLVAAGETMGNAVQVIHALEGTSMVMFVEAEKIFDDPADVDFFTAYNAANGDMASVQGFETSQLRSKFQGGYVAPTAKANTHVEPKWYDGTRDLTASQVPGEFALHLIFEDSTLSEVSHFGDDFGNGYSDCTEAHVSASIYKLVFIPKQAMDFTLETSYIPEEEGAKETIIEQKDFTNVTPGTAYALLSPTMGYENGCLPRTFKVRMKNGHLGMGKILAECGD